MLNRGMKRFIGLFSAFAALLSGIMVASAEDGSVSQAKGDAKDSPSIREQRSETAAPQTSYRRRSTAKRTTYRTMMYPAKLPWAPNAPGD